MAITAIAHTELGAGGATFIEFTSIPSTFTDLLLLTSLRTDRAGSFQDNVLLRFNGDTGSNYSRTELLGAGGVTSTSRTTNATSISTVQASAATSTASYFGGGMIYVANYSYASGYKQVIVNGTQENTSTIDSQQAISSGLWRSNSAITSLRLFPNTGPNFVQYSSATLYGIKKA